MPELPEVEVVRQGLARGVVGRTVDRVHVAHPRAVRRHLAGADDFRALLEGRTLLAARRRGKYLWLPLDTGDALTAHLGMSGQLLVQPPEAPEQPHLRVRITFRDGGRELRFVDQRTFGGLAVVAAGGAGAAPGAGAGADAGGAGAATLDPDTGTASLEVPSPGTSATDALCARRPTDEGAAADDTPTTLRHVARDPLDPLFDDDLFATRLRARRTGVKRALLDQTLVSGIGNIYADETLWRSRLHGGRATEALTRPRCAELLGHARAVLRESLAQGGTSFDALYVSVEGVSGLFERSLAVYGREGEPCLRCGAPVVREAFMNRSSYSCPRCQPRPRAPR